MATSWLQVELS